MGFKGVYITRASFHDVKVASQNKAVKTETALDLRNQTGGRKKSQEKQSRKKSHGAKLRHKRRNLAGSKNQNGKHETEIRTMCRLIRITCPCNVYPLEPNSYITKQGFIGVYLFFLFFLFFSPKHRLWVLVRTVLTKRF